MKPRMQRTASINNEYNLAKNCSNKNPHFVEDCKFHDILLCISPSSTQSIIKMPVVSNF